ncbi:MAG: hypothetical protein ACQEWI_00330 [Bacillota bacterium]
MLTTKFKVHKTKGNLNSEYGYTSNVIISFGRC